jgi:superfamily I DNA/RNA helicase
MRLLFREEDRRILQLTEEQAYVRAYILHRDRAVVTGPPGSGKTMLAVAIATHLAERGTPTLLTCFNRKLADHLRLTTGEAENLHVTNFHALCMEVAKEAGLAVPEPGTPGDRAFFEETLPGLLEEGARSLDRRYGAIVVDEAQDFLAWWWPALLSMHEDPDRGPLYVFADSSQNLYRGDEIPVGTGTDTLVLHENLRTTQPIGEFVSVFFDPAHPAGVPKGPTGRDVEVLDYEGEDELVHLLEVVLTNLIDEEGLDLDDIVVLTPAGRDKSVLWARRAIGRFTLSDDVNEGTVLWSTVHAFKGLERAIVILAELGQRHEDDIERFLRVGCSRARNHLIVLATRQVAREIRWRAKVAAP